MLISTNDNGGREEMSETSAVLVSTIDVGLDETRTLVSLCSAPSYTKRPAVSMNPPGLVGNRGLGGSSGPVPGRVRC
jgi:hypothetical protein